MQNTAGPTIINSNLSQTASQISKNPKGFFKRNLIIIVIAVLVLAVLVEMVFGVLTLFSPTTARKINILQPSVNELSSARLSLVPNKSGYKKGDTVTVDVKLYTGGYSTTSTDLAIKYDPAFLKPSTQTPVAVGQIYPEYPPIQVLEPQGLIGISGINFQEDQTFSGVGIFAKLNFTALKDGQTDLVIQYEPNSTGDSNVVLASSLKDILGGVDNAKINISATGSESEMKVESCGRFTQYCEDVSGKVGTQVCNAGTMKDSICTYDSQLTTSCEECKI